MSTLGQELKREREMRGIPLQEIARQTKINLSYLMALEQDHLDLLPGEFFIKGTIRAYAKVVGLDEEQALNLYRRSDRQPGQAVARTKSSAGTKMTPGRWKKLALTILPLLLLTAVLLIFRPWRTGERRTARPAAPAATSERIRSEANLLPSPTPAVKPAAKPEEQGLRLQIEFRDVVWLRVQTDSGAAEEALLQPGERKTVTAAERIILRLGRPDRVEMTINGRKAKLFPPSASAQTYEITIANYKAFLSE